jgi:hypothetical protein
LKHWKTACIAIFILWALSPVAAQDTPAVISADNITHLQSVAHIDFADAPLEAGKIDNGWFAMDAWGKQYAVKNQDDHLVIWNDAGQMLDQYFVEGADGLPATVLDFAFDGWDASVVSAHSDGKYLYAASYSVGGDFILFRELSTDTPLRVWVGSQFTDMLEMSSNDPLLGRYVMEINPQRPIDHSTSKPIDLLPDDIHQFPSGPENDPDAFLRIGRIEAPFAITLTRDSLLKLWDLEWEGGVVIGHAQLSELPGMGAVNTTHFEDFPDIHPPDYFAWRDGESKALHLLNIQTGEDRMVADLGGTYLPFMTLTPAADVIIAVNTGLEPVVTAWNTATGERYDLGEYRGCKRQPDMVRLSQDGTTLAIGCDTGIDIWRVKNAD